MADCPFDLELVNTIEEVATSVDSEIFTLVQPKLLVDLIDPRLVSVAQYGSLIIETSDITKLGSVPLRLRTWSRRYPGEDENKYTDIIVNFLPCLNVEMDLEVDLGLFEYTLGDEVTEFATVERLVDNCDNSELTMAADVDPAFTVTIVNSTVTVSLESTDIAVGDHVVTILETDIYTGLTVSSSLTVEVLSGKVFVPSFKDFGEIDSP